MAAETTFSRLGQSQNTGGSYANDTTLFLKKFAGEVLTMFETASVAKDLHLMRTIQHGKSAQFPATGKATAKYHAIGDDITIAASGYLSQIAHAERVIGVDNTLLASTMISRWDEMVNHYDVRSIYTEELGRALAKKFDKTVLQVAILAARATKTITVAGQTGFDGASITNANLRTSGADLLAAIFSAAQKLDEQDVPENDRYVVVTPAMYYNLVKEQDLLNRDFGNDGNGIFADGTVFKAAGIQIVKSNNLPSTNIAAETGPSNSNTYHGDFTNTAGVVFHKSAIGTVKLMDLAMESEYKIEMQGHLMVAKYAMGHGILRPECAIELKVA